MHTPDRRTFGKQAAAVAAGAATACRAAPSLAAAGSNERLTVGVIGMSRGLRLAPAFAQHGAKIAYVCDVDQRRLDRARQETGADQSVTDFRRILDDKAVDAVVVATPDHWHAPIAILACQAGKHVYVEKPCAHNIREGRLLIEAARNTNRVVQVGSQSRSTPVLQNGIRLVREGALGEILVAKAWNSQRRSNIGRRQPSKPPAGFDYNMWVGPAPMRPFQANCHHYTWHWWYDFGTGDMGNDGVHELDIALWGLGVETHPTSVAGHSTKLYFDDDQQFPDTQYVTFKYAAGKKSERTKLLAYEQRIWSPYDQDGFANGNAFYGTKGYMILSKMGGWKWYSRNSKLIQTEKGRASLPHHTADFIDAVKTGRRPSADIDIGHRAATLAHLANILARSGKKSLQFDPAAEKVVDDDPLNAWVRRTYRHGHWAVPRGAEL